MKSIVLIIPYFGKLPAGFKAWKLSALNNASVDFLFYTDVEEIQEEKNVKVIRTTFSEFAERFKKKFPFDIALSSPYKLCDFKPTYGYVLSDDIAKYDFWGHCDVDLLFGDIRKFVTEEILSSNDKILEHGHFTLYRNDETLNTAFMKGKGYKDYDYVKALSSKDANYFDEFLGTQIIHRKLKVKSYLNEKIFFDALERSKAFKHIDDCFSETVFKYEDGKLFAITKNNGETEYKEILYAHFQKRKINYRDFRADTREFYIVPNKLLSAESVKDETKLFKVRFSKAYLLKKKFEHLKTYLKRYASGNYRSFIAYRAERKAFSSDMKNAKKAIKEWKSNDFDGGNNDV